MQDTISRRNYNILSNMTLPEKVWVVKGSRRLETAIMQENMIEKMVIGEDFEKNREKYSIGREFPLTVWSIFFTDIENVTKDDIDYGTMMLRLDEDILEGEYFNSKKISGHIELYRKE